MKRLLAGIIVATLAYSGWWFYAVHAMRTDAQGWFEDLRAQGWQADFSDLTVRGFPNRTDLTVANPVLMSRNGAVGWQAPFFQILALSYKRDHVIVAWPEAQTLTIEGTETAITSDGLRASVVFDGQDILRSNLEAPVLNLTGPDMSLALADTNIALEKTTDSSYRFALSAGSIATSSPRAASGIGPDSLASARAETVLEFDRPLRLDTLTDAPPRLTRIDVQRSEITYGAVTFRIALAATLDGQGQPTGDMSITADNWREGIDAARENGDLPPAVSDGLIDLLTLLSTFNGTRDSLDVTLGINRGTLLLGPLPVGTLPPLRWH